jgi:hypothetical protein
MQDEIFFAARGIAARGIAADQALLLSQIATASPHFSLET